MQINYDLHIKEGYAGLIADTQLSNVATKAVEEALGIPFGYGVVAGTDPSSQVRLPNAEISVITFDADFVASNTIDLDVNKESIAQVTFATDHLTTADLVKDAIEALAIDGITCVVSGAGRIFTIETPDADILIENVVVAAGGSQAGHTVAYSTDNIFRGFAVHTHLQATEISGYGTRYKDKSACGYLTKGPIWVPCVTGVNLTIDEAIYIVASGANAGKCTNVSTDNIATGAVCVKAQDADDLAVVQLDSPLP